MNSVQQRTFKHNRKQAAEMMADLVRAIRRVVEANVGLGSSFEQREAMALEVTNEACRYYFEQDLQDMSEGFGDELRIDGLLYRRSHQPGKGRYHSLCGSLCVSRATYRRVGERNGATVVPLELQAGIAHRATPALAYSIALGYAKHPSRLYQEDMNGAYRKVPSRSTVERIGKALGMKAQRQAPRIERYLRMSEGIPEGTVAVSMGLDRTSVPFEEQRDAAAPPKTRRKQRTKPYVRVPPPPVDVNYHMAYVGTVSFVDIDAETLVTRKYSATHHDGPAGILSRMVADVRAAKLRMPHLMVGIVQDGAPEMWNLMRNALDAEQSIEHYEQGIDRYHLNERLGKVLTVTEKSTERRSELLKQWKRELDKDDATIDRIYDYIEQQACFYDGQDLDLLLDNLTYLDNNSDRMRYVKLRKAGLPVGSGATEGSCKSLVSFRAKRSGQRWHNQGVAAALTLRAIVQSERLPPFWSHLHRCYCAKIFSNAA